jgi:cyanophycinase
MVGNVLPVPLCSIVRAFAAFTVAIMTMTHVALAQTTLPKLSAKDTKGTLLIMGGAVRPDNSEIWNRLITAAGGKGAPRHP